MSAALTVSVYVMWAFLILIAYAVFVLYRHFGQMYVSSPSGRASQGPDVGSALLSIARSDVAGREVTLPVARQPAIVLFVSIGCSLCSEIRDQLGSLDSYSDRIKTVVFCSGGLDDVRAWAGRVPGYVHVIRDAKSAAANHYQVNTLPFVLAVDAAGRVRNKSIINDHEGLSWAAEEALARSDADGANPTAGGIEITEVARR